MATNVNPSEDKATKSEASDPSPSSDTPLLSTEQSNQGTFQAEKQPAAKPKEPVKPAEGADVRNEGPELEVLESEVLEPVPQHVGRHGCCATFSSCRQNCQGYTFYYLFTWFCIASPLLVILASVTYRAYNTTLGLIIGVVAALGSAIILTRQVLTGCKCGRTAASEN